MKQSTKAQIKWMYAIAGKCMAFNNEKNPYHVVRYKKSRHKKYETGQLRKLTALLITKLFTKNKKQLK